MRYRYILPLFLGFLLLPLTSTAQYFGRNKVQYDRFDFRIMHTEHFDIYFYPEEEQATHDAARMAERWYARLSDAFVHNLRGRQPVFFYANDADFQQTPVIAGLIGQGTGGVTEALRRRVVMPFTGIYRENDHVLGHELVHAFQYSIAFDREDTLRNRLPFHIGNLPLWLVEGMAEYLSVGRQDPHTAMWMRDAVLYDDIPDIRTLTYDYRYFPYRFGQALLAYIGGNWGDRSVTELYKVAGRVPLDTAFVYLFGMDTDSLSRQWVRELHNTYEPILASRTRPEQTGKTILSPEKGGRMNVGPALSPDGKYVVFISDRDIFTNDLYLADAQTGRIIRKLTSSAATPHFDALRFINSSGTWSPDGKQFAVVIFKEGDNALAILDVETGHIQRTIHPEGIPALTNPAWSPDGRYIAFTGIVGGISDLFIYDLTTDTVTRITNDKYADLQPAWSPDGQALAFVSDRTPQTDFEQLTYGPLNIFLFYPATGAIHALPLFPNAKNINPQFSPDGQSLFFIADPDGISNIYRFDLRDRWVYRVTQTATGISGITATAPALSVSMQHGRLAFSIFAHRKYLIATLEPEEATGQRVDIPLSVFLSAGILPPPQALKESLVELYLSDPVTGLPPADVTYPVTPYRPRITLDFIGPPSIGAAYSPFGTFIVGSAAFHFSDMMNQHEITTIVQASGTLRDIGGVFAYWNRVHRWNWGLQAAHIPYLSGFAFQRFGFIGGIPVTETIQIIERLFYNELSGMAAYPFDTFRRAEASLAYTRYSSELQVDTLITAGGGIVYRSSTRIPGLSPLNMIQTSTAYVGDNSYFGFTSPTAGWRYRFEADYNTGDLQFTTLLADYRRYIFLRPVTFAWRILHYGRYGKDSDRLAGLSVGYPTLVRGYDPYSFSSSECTPTPDGACAEFVRTIGSRLGVASAELRIPLFGTEEFGLVNMPYLPMELVLFADAGVAWTSEEPPVLKWSIRTTERVPVFSTGISSRINIGGAFVLELYLAKPFQRPARNLIFGLTFAPGW